MRIFAKLNGSSSANTLSWLVKASGTDDAKLPLMVWQRFTRSPRQPVISGEK